MGRKESNQTKEQNNYNFKKILYINFVLANSADTDEKNVAFNLGLHCLQKHMFIKG